MFIVLEADDVSDSAQKEQNDTVGATTNNRDEQDDLTNTSDILGTKDNTGGNTDDVDSNDENNDNASDSDNDEDETPDDENNSDNDEIGNTDDEVEDDELIIRRKKILRENMAYLYDIIHDNINTLKNGSITANTKDEIESLDRIVNNLTDCEEVLYKTLTDGYRDSKYEDINKIYISAKKVYDISIKMMFEHFDVMEKSLSSKK